MKTTVDKLILRDSILWEWSSGVLGVDEGYEVNVVDGVPVGEMLVYYLCHSASLSIVPYSQSPIIVVSTAYQGSVCGQVSCSDAHHPSISDHKRTTFHGRCS